MTTNTTPLTLEEYTAYFAAWLTRRDSSILVHATDPDAPSLSIQFAGDDGATRDVYFDNFYRRYRNGAPLQELFEQHYDAIMDAKEVEGEWEDADGDEEEVILPMLKPAEFLAEVAKLNENTPAASTPLSERVTDNLAIMYVEEGPVRMRFLTMADLDGQPNSQADVAALARENLISRVPSLQVVDEENGFFEIQADGTYEATFAIVLDHVLPQLLNLAPDAKVAVGVPSRDCLFVADPTQAATAVQRLKLAVEGCKEQAYPISQELYEWDGKGLKVWTDTV